MISCLEHESPFSLTDSAKKYISATSCSRIIFVHESLKIFLEKLHDDYSCKEANLPEVVQLFNKGNRGQQRLNLGQIRHNYTFVSLKSD